MSALPGDKGQGGAPERRRTRRLRLAPRLTVYDARNGDALGEVVDVSGHGLLLASPAPLTLHRRYRMRVVLPGAPAAAIVFTAEAAWSARALNPAGYRTGFRDLAVVGGRERLLDRLIEACYAVTD